MLATLQKLLLLSLALAPVTRLAAAEVRVSFLSEKDAVTGLVTILRYTGVKPEAIQSLQRALEWYNSVPSSLDTTNFPQEKQGRYCFESMSHLVRSLPHPLSEINHEFQLNCFDAAILLSGGRLRTSLRPDLPAGPFLVYCTDTNSRPYY